MSIGARKRIVATAPGKSTARRAARKSPTPATIVEDLAAFSAGAKFEALPEDAVAESKRSIMDSIGCALAGQDDMKGRIGSEFGRRLGHGASEATIIGQRDRVSEFGAAFANAELINALDYDLIVPPGHVTPQVLAPIMAVAETRRRSGTEVVVANAVAHEMSHRIGKAMDHLRDTKDGVIDTPPVFGYACTILGGAAASARLAGLDETGIAHAIAIAAVTSHVNPQIAWFDHAPGPTFKYLLTGTYANAAMTAMSLAELGHRGTLAILDDREFGYARFIGTRKWDPDCITDGLGRDWGFAALMAYKPFPHCRNNHALFSIITELVAKHDIKPHEIEGIHVWVEGFTQRPIWLNQEIRSVIDAQFSIAHGVAVCAHRPPVGKEWQDPTLVFSDSVMKLMRKVTNEPHPHYVDIRSRFPTSQPAFAEIRARGRVYSAERTFARGGRTPDPTTYLDDDELIAKFRHNADPALGESVATEVAEAVMGLENVTDFSSVMNNLRPPL